MDMGGMQMQVNFIEGVCADEIRKNCYFYLLEKYRKEVLMRDRDLRQGEHGRASQEGIQLKGSDQSLQRKSE